jgi:hypothetical protein
LSGAISAEWRGVSHHSTGTAPLNRGEVEM